MSDATDMADANRSLRRAGLAGAAVLACVAGALWLRYGGAVFAEMMASAWAFCF